MTTYDGLTLKISIDEESYLEVERKIADLYKRTHLGYIGFFVGLIVGFAACMIAVSLP